MAQIDASIYNNLRGVDLLGSFQRGMQIKDARDQKSLQEQDRQHKAEIQKAYQSGVIQNPDGTTSYDIKKTQGALGALTGNPYAGEAAYGIGNTIFTRDQAAAKAVADAKQQEIDNQYRRDALASSAADRAEARNERRYQAGLAKEEKIQGLQTPYGLANTTDDAKQLKDGHLSKRAFDNKLQQMIDLRTKHEGGAILNREDVARGKQLSKDLLLEYKNMAKLGVLSKSDEDIINSIIPEDPLEYNSPLAAIQGQDPTLNRLKAFQADSNKNFEDGVATRTRGGLRGQLAEKPTGSTGKKPSWAL